MPKFSREQLSRLSPLSFSKRELAISLSSLILGVGAAALGAQELDSPSEKSAEQTKPAPNHAPKPVKNRRKDTEPKPEVMQQRFGAYNKYTAGKFLTILKGTVHLPEDAVVHDAPAEDGEFAAAGRKVTKLPKSEKIANPVTVEDPAGKQWLLVNSPKGAGYVNLSRGPLDTYDTLPKSITIERNNRKRRLATTADVQKYDQQVLVQDNRAFRASEDNLEFEIQGFTFDAQRASKQDLVKQARNAELLPLSKPVK